PAGFQVPPSPKLTPEPGALQRVWDGPPAAGIFFSMSSAKKAMYWLSGDQNGLLAPSVWSRRWADDDPRGRTHSARRPSALLATSAIVLPSGEIAAEDIGPGGAVVPSGQESTNRTVAGSGALGRSQAAAPAAANTLVTAHGRMARRVGGAATGATVL